MKIKKRKRKASTEEQFTVVGKDSSSVEIIEQLARHRKIEVSRKGHAKNRLYFRCVPEKKEQFLNEISDLCFWESAVVPPKRILRRFRNSLLNVTTNRLDNKTAQDALNVAVEKSGNSENPPFVTKTMSEQTKTFLSNTSAINIKPSILKSAICGLKSCISQVRFFIRPKRFVATAKS